MTLRYCQFKDKGELENGFVLFCVVSQDRLSRNRYERQELSRLFQLRYGGF